MNIYRIDRLNKNGSLISYAWKRTFICSLLRVTWLLHFAGVRVSQKLQICSRHLNRLKSENEKNDRKTESKPRNKIFSR